jgi:hypothetical protein
MRKCKFCSKPVEKLVDSHIIPKAFFIYTRSISDKIGQSDHMLMITNTKGQQPKRRLRIGWYDSNLVCQECEARFKPYDEYAIQLLLKQENKQKPVVKDGENIAWTVDDYSFKKLKLFIISLLWRAGASDLPPFKRINPGKELEKAKQLILSDNSGKENEFSFVLARFGDNAGKAFIVDPHVEFKNDAFGDLNCYRFYLGAGYIVYVKVDKRPFPQESEEISAIDGKPLWIIRRSDFSVSKEWEVFKKVLHQADENFSKIKSNH